MAFQDGASIGYGSDDSLQDLADRWRISPNSLLIFLIIKFLFLRSSPLLKQSKIFDNRGIHLEKVFFISQK